MPSSSRLRPEAGDFNPSAAPALRPQQPAPASQSLWLPSDPHLSIYRPAPRIPTGSPWHGTLLWESYFSTFLEEEHGKAMLEDLRPFNDDGQVRFAYPPNTIIPPPLGEIRMDSDGNERMYQIEGLGLLTATRLAELEEERRQRAERRGEKFERRPRQLIRHRHEWIYHHPDHAGERRWRGLTDPERDPSDHAIFQRRRREDGKPGPPPHTVEAHREQQRKMRECDGDLAATRREVLEMVRGDLEDHQQRVAAALTTPPPPHAFVTQLEYITSVSLVIQHHRQQRQHQHEQRQQQQQQQQEQQHHQQQPQHQNQHQNDPQRQRSNLRPEEEEHEKQQEWSFLPSYELRQVSGRESWETNSKTAEYLKRLAQSHLPSGYYQEIRDDLALLETLLADHPNKTFYQGIYGDLKRWKQGSPPESPKDQQ